MPDLAMTVAVTFAEGGIENGPALLVEAGEEPLGVVELPEEAEE